MKEKLSGTPIVKRRIEALLKKTVGNGCTPEEATTAKQKADEMIAKYGFGPESFRETVAPSTAASAATSAPKTSKPPRSTASGRGRGIGKLAEQLIAEHPDWTYRHIAEEVNGRIVGAKATEKSVRRYASRMRKSGNEVAHRPRQRRL